MYYLQIISSLKLSNSPTKQPMSWETKLNNSILHPDLILDDDSPTVPPRMTKCASALSVFASDQNNQSLVEAKAKELVEEQTLKLRQ
jgi:hypothetical protein